MHKKLILLYSQNSCISLCILFCLFGLLDCLFGWLVGCWFVDLLIVQVCALNLLGLSCYAHLSYWRATPI